MTTEEAINILKHIDEYSQSEINLAIEIAISVMEEYLDQNKIIIPNTIDIQNISDGESGSTGPGIIPPSFLNEKYEKEKKNEI